MVISTKAHVTSCNSKVHTCVGKNALYMTSIYGHSLPEFIYLFLFDIKGNPNVKDCLGQWLSTTVLKAACDSQVPFVRPSAVFQENL